MRAVVIAAVLGGLASAAMAQPAPDKARAKELYLSAEAAMQAKDYDLAVREYGAAYEITHDPILFYKIGTANERAGKCPIAVIYFRRYLAEGKPTPAFIDITNARIRACDPTATDTKPTPPVDTKPTPPVDTKPTAPVETKPTPVTTTPDSVEPPKAEPKTTMGGFVGSREGGPPKTAFAAKNRAAWLLVTGSIAFLTVGAVLAYSADSAESDISDLYVGFGGNPPVFDEDTKALYDDLIAEGQRYERLSWVSFGLAGASAGVAAFLFWREYERTKHDKPLTVTPTVSKDGAGVSATLRF